MAERRRRPPDLLRAHLAPRDAFWCGVVVIVGFLLQGSLAVRAVQVACFAALAMLSGKRIRWVYFLVMVASITAFNLLTPLGRVLLRVGPFSVTRGALEQGLQKGLAIAGLVFVSLFAVRPELTLPGRFGGAIARVFYYFERILDNRRRVDAARLVASLDEVLFEVYPITTEGKEALPEQDVGPESGSAGREGGSTSTIGAMLIVLIAGSTVALAIMY